MKRDIVIIVILLALVFLLLLFTPRPARAEQSVVGSPEHVAQCSILWSRIKNVDFQYVKLRNQVEDLGRIYGDLETQLKAIEGSISFAKRTRNFEDLETARAHKEFHVAKMDALRLEGEMVVATLNELEVSSVSLMLGFLKNDCKNYDRERLVQIFSDACSDDEFAAEFPSCEIYQSRG